MSLKGYIYLVDVGDGLYKLGSTCNVEQRIRKLPFAVKLLTAVWVNDVSQAEQNIHLYYRRYLVGGEYFRLPSEAVTEICAMRFVPTVPASAGPRSVTIHLASDILAEIDRQAAELGFHSRQTYLVQLVGAISSQPTALVDELLQTFAPVHTAAKL